MKTEFTKEYILSNRGCYDRDEVMELNFINKEKITIEDLLEDLLEGLSMDDFIWFFTKKCELTVKELQYFALDCAEFVEPNYRKEFPNDERVKDCINTTRLFLEGKATVEQLTAARSAARSAAESAAWSAKSAARSAARSAAWSAKSARSAAWSAKSAKSAAWSAVWSARSAAWSAEYKEFIYKQVQKLK